MKKKVYIFAKYLWLLGMYGITIISFRYFNLTDIEQIGILFIVIVILYKIHKS